jgi:hypothetical protein
MILYLLEAAPISYICLQVSSPGSFVLKISSTEWFVPGCGSTGLFVPDWMVLYLVVAALDAWIRK